MGREQVRPVGVDPVTGNVFAPTEVFTNEGLEKVVSGWTHSCGVTKTGEVYNWGRNNYGQLGSQRAVAQKPEKLTGLPEINQLSCGSEHNLGVTKDGKLYAWGWNEHGSCGTGDSKDVAKPRQVLANRKIKLAFACTGQSFAVVE